MWAAKWHQVVVKPGSSFSWLHVWPLNIPSWHQLHNRSHIQVSVHSTLSVKLKCIWSSTVASDILIPYTNTQKCVIVCFWDLTKLMFVIRSDGLPLILLNPPSKRLGRHLNGSGFHGDLPLLWKLNIAHYMLLVGGISLFAVPCGTCECKRAGLHLIV